jgi:anti-sigma B factor antagonist
MDIIFPETRDQGVLIAAPSGELDLYAASEFASAVLARMDPSLRAVVIDMSGVGYLDSSGTGALIRILYRARPLGARLILAGLRKGPKQVLNMVNILALVKSFGTVDEAVDEASEGGESRRKNAFR